MKQGIFTITSNKPVASAQYRMTLEGDTSAITRPGQFINIRLDGFFLRRPISVCDWNSNEIAIIYKVVGQGTEVMTTLASGDRLDILTGLGNGFDTSISGDRPLLIGGGVGTPPMLALAKTLVAEGKHPVAILGFNSADSAVCVDDFTAAGIEVFVTTVDGSMGIKGFVTAALDRIGTYTYFYACGNIPMLRAVYNATTTSGQLSFEERMGCGFGACMGCTCQTKYGAKRICRDGPVLKKEEIIW